MNPSVSHYRLEMSDFPALPGFYNFLFLHLEPSEIVLVLA